MTDAVIFEVHLSHCLLLSIFDCLLEFFISMIFVIDEFFWVQLHFLDHFLCNTHEEGVLGHIGVTKLSLNDAHAHDMLNHPFLISVKFIN